MSLNRYVLKTTNIYTQLETETNQVPQADKNRSNKMHISRYVSFDK